MQGLDVDVLAAAVEIEEPAGPVLSSLIQIPIAAGMPASGPPLTRLIALSGVRYFCIVNPSEQRTS